MPHLHHLHTHWRATSGHSTATGATALDALLALNEQFPWPFRYRRRYLERRAREAEGAVGRVESLRR